MYRIIGSDQKEYGPVSADHVRQWLAQGRVNARTQIKPDGAAEWQALSTLPEFAKDLAEAAPPPVMAAPNPAAPASGEGINVIIPYKNVRALVAYYLAVFSLIPFLGMPLGLAALVLGIMGLRFRRQNPTAGGVVHAWIGIILGGLCGFGWLFLLIAMLFSLRTRMN